MLNAQSFTTLAPAKNRGAIAGAGWRSRGFIATKRITDFTLSLSLLPILLLTGILLFALNPWLNKGPLLFTQKRMGQGCRPFTAYKFRSMSVAPAVQRSAECPLEVDRITALGGFIRRSRLDELPQIFNVFRGEMSLIGPRPDCFEHAEYYLRSVPGYRKRHLVRPGISGLAQTQIGYVAGSDATARKVQADLYYLANADVRMDLWIIWRTLSVVLGRKGA